MLPIVIIYIWYPAGYESDSIEFFSGIYRQEDTFTTNIFKTVRDWERAVGHASLFVRNLSGDELYLSFWPDSSKGDFYTLIRSFVPMRGKFLETLDEDIQGMGRKPDREIRLSWEVHLSIQTYNAAIKLKYCKDRYNILSRNCSTLVTLALKEGVIGQDRAADLKAFGSRVGEVLKLVLVASDIFKICKNTDKNIHVSHLFSRKNVSLVRATFSLPEAFFGIKTPKSVEEYAERLRKTNDLLIKEMNSVGAVSQSAGIANGSFSSIQHQDLPFIPSKVDARSKVNSKLSLDKLPAKLQGKNSAAKPHIKSVSRLVYTGIFMALCVQLFRANNWQFLLFESYENAFATSFFLIACGIARTAQIWQNSWVSLGLFLTTISGFAWKYKWVLPIVKTYEIPLCIGIALILYGLVPQLLGVMFFIPGSILVGNELWLIFTQGLAVIHYNNLLAGIILLVLSIGMFRRYKYLEKRGVFRRRKMGDSDV